MYIYTHTYTYTYTYIYTGHKPHQIQAYLTKYKHTYTCMYIHTHTHTHTYIQGTNRTKSKHILQSMEPEMLQLGLSQKQFQSLLDLIKPAEPEDGNLEKRYNLRSRGRSIQDVSLCVCIYTFLD